MHQKCRLPPHNWLSCHDPIGDPIQGDFVDDTPPVDYANLPLHCDPFDSCPLDNEDDLSTNLMSNLTDCITLNSDLTDGQVQRMKTCVDGVRSTLVSSENLIATGTTLEQVPSYVISSNTTWNLSTLPSSTLHAQETIVVEEGVNFAIGAGVAIHFCEGTGIVVKKGAKLFSYGAYLTSTSPNTKWHGITLYGDAAGYPSGVAEIKTYNNTTIENAEIGVRNYGPTPSSSGAFVILNKTHFINNTVAIDGKPNNTFAAIYAGESTFTNSGQLEFESFVKLNEVEGWGWFVGCSFTNSSTGNCLSNYGIGIQASSTTVSLLNCDFNGLGFGLKTEAHFESKPNFIKSCDFKNCFTGIYSNGINNLKVRENNFFLDEVPASTVTSCTDGIDIERNYGIFLEDAALGIEITDENFFKDGNVNVMADTPISIAAQNIGTTNNEVSKNIFETINGIYSQGANATNFTSNAPNVPHSGLFFNCNDFMNNTGVAAEGDYFNQLALRKLQFNWLAGQDYIAANVFNPAAQDIKNSAALDIQYKFDGSMDENPVFSIGVTTIEDAMFDCFPTPGAPGPTDHGVINGLTDPKGTVTNIKTGIDETLIFIDQNQNNGNEYVTCGGYQELDQSIASLIGIYLAYPETWNENDFLGYLALHNSYTADITALKYMYKMNSENVSSILTRLENYEGSEEEQIKINDVIELYEWLSNKNVNSLNTGDLSYLQNLVINTDNRAKTWAKSFLSLYGVHFYPILNKSTKASKRSQAISTQHSAFKVYPNPSSQYIGIMYDGKNQAINSEKVELILSSVDGKIVKDELIKINEKISVSELNPGIYFIKIVVDDVEIHTDKIIKI